MKKAIILGIALLILGFIGLGYGFYLYNKPAMKIENEEPVLSTTSKELSNNFSNNAEKLSTEFIGKVIEVKGIVSLIEKGNESTIVILEDGIKCEFNNSNVPFKKSEEIVVKGIFSGYDDMFNELSLAKCHIVK